jgi:hypothetical protein
MTVFYVFEKRWLSFQPVSLPVLGLRTTVNYHVWLVACGYNCIPTSIAMFQQSQNISLNPDGASTVYFISAQLILIAMTPSG